MPNALSGQLLPVLRRRRPESIPQLTYEQFLACHRRFYAPSNARFFLDGPVQIGDILTFIGDTYLSRCDHRTSRPGFLLLRPISAQRETAEYECAPGEDPSGKAHFVLGKVVGTWQQVDRLLALEVLLDYLAGSNSAPRPPGRCWSRGWERICCSPSTTASPSPT